MTQQEFIAWEQVSRDTIDVKRCYIDLAGDLVAGVLLSQIVYWHLPDKNGNDKLQVVKDGEKWLAKGREDWWEECRITPKQFDRACTLLENLGLIITDLKRFNGSPMKHLRICWDVFLRDLLMQSMKIKGAKEAEGKMDIDQRVKSKCPKRQNRIRPLVKMEIDERANSLTETPLSKNTQRIKAKRPPSAARQEFSSFSPTQKPKPKEPEPIPDASQSDETQTDEYRAAYQQARKALSHPDFKAKHGRPSGPADWDAGAREKMQDLKMQDLKRQDLKRQDLNKT